MSVWSCRRVVADMMVVCFAVGSVAEFVCEVEFGVEVEGQACCNFVEECSYFGKLEVIDYSPELENLYLLENQAYESDNLTGENRFVVIVVESFFQAGGWNRYIDFDCTFDLVGAC